MPEPHQTPNAAGPAAGWPGMEPVTDPNDSPPDPTGEPEAPDAAETPDAPGPEPVRRSRRRLPLPQLRRESRIGLAALLSFLTLIGALIGHKFQGRGSAGSDAPTQVAEVESVEPKVEPSRSEPKPPVSAHPPAPPESSPPPPPKALDHPTPPEPAPVPDLRPNSALAAEMPPLPAGTGPELAALGVRRSPFDRAPTDPLRQTSGIELPPVPEEDEPDPTASDLPAESEPADNAPPEANPEPPAPTSPVISEEARPTNPPPGPEIPEGVNFPDLSVEGEPADAGSPPPISEGVNHEDVAPFTFPAPPTISMPESETPQSPPAAPAPPSVHEPIEPVESQALEPPAEPVGEEAAAPIPRNQIPPLSPAPARSRPQTETVEAPPTRSGDRERGPAGDLLPLRNAGPGRIRLDNQMTRATDQHIRPVPTAPQPEPAQPAPTTIEPIEPLRHVVRSGENFFIIARRYYGSGRYYMSLWAANREEVAAPDRLFVGQTIQVPPIEDLDPNLVIRTPSTTSPRRSPPLVAEQAPTPSRLINSETEAEDRGSLRDLPVYTVRPNDTLRTIARDTLGDPHRDREIFDLNRRVIRDPSRLAVGQPLRLPLDAQGRQVVR